MSYADKFLFKVLLIPFGIVIFVIMLLMMLGGSSSSEETVASSGLNIPFNKDIKYRVTSPFGHRNITVGTNDHKGIDLAVPLGTEILASANGYVVSYKVSVLTGESVVLEHNIDGVIYRTIYYHMTSNSVVVRDGQKVLAGQKIGIVGATGTQATGVHLHFEVRTYNDKTKSFVPIDPQYIFDKHS